VLGLSAKLYLKAMDMSATLNPKVIFIILIIILNLHDPSLSEFGCKFAISTLDLRYRSDCKVVL